MVPPILTAVAPVRFLPVIVIVAKVVAEVGAKEVIAGGGFRKVNPARFIVPPTVVILTFPLAPLPITAVIVVELITEKCVAAEPPKLTSVTFEKFVPVIVTVESVVAAVGVKDVIVGAATNVNPALFAVPPPVVTFTLPLVAPDVTTAVI